MDKNSMERTDTAEPFAGSEMLIRKPAEEVFEALVSPEITSKFWFTKSSGRLEPGKTIRWEWEMYNVGADIEVNEVVPDELITFEWPGEDNTMRSVKITFEPRGESAVFVSVTEKGWKPDAEGLLEQVRGQTGGWTMVLCALKAFMEFNIILTVVADHSPGE